MIGISGGIIITLGIVIWFIAALRSGMDENITENKLKTDGIYSRGVKLFNSRHKRGDYTEITYYDDADQMVDPEEATRVRIREMLADGAVVKEVWGFCGNPIKKPA